MSAEQPFSSKPTFKHYQLTVNLPEYEIVRARNRADEALDSYISEIMGAKHDWEVDVKSEWIDHTANYIYLLEEYVKALEEAYQVDCLDRINELYPEDTEQAE